MRGVTLTAGVLGAVLLLVQGVSQNAISSAQPATLISEDPLSKLVTHFIRSSGGFFVRNAWLRDPAAHRIAKQNLRPGRLETDKYDLDSWDRFKNNGHSMEKADGGVIFWWFESEYTYMPGIVSHSTYQYLTIAMPNDLVAALGSGPIDIAESDRLLVFFSTGDDFCFAYASAGTIFFDGPDGPDGTAPVNPETQYISLRVRFEFDRVAEETSVTAAPPYDPVCPPFVFERKLDFFPVTIDELAEFRKFE